MKPFQQFIASCLTLCLSLQVFGLQAMAADPSSLEVPAGSEGISAEAGQDQTKALALQSEALSHVRTDEQASLHSSRGFFASQNADEAVTILDTLFPEETELGDAADATNLDNMLASLDIIEDANTIRASFNKPALRITHALMAYSQARANWSYAHKSEGHAPRPVMGTGSTLPSGLSYWGENLDNYGDPRLDVTGRASLSVPRNSFDPWFYYEKALADAGETEGIGHYENIMEDFSYSGAAFTSSDSAYAGFIPAGKWGTCIQNFGNSFRPAVSYSVDEYRSMLQTYIDNLPPAESEPLLVTLENDSFTFTNAPIIPKISVSCEGRTLQEGTDYTLSCTENLNAGQAQGLVTGTGRYQGKNASFTFTISPLPWDKAVLSYGLTGIFYTGSPQTPSETLSYTMHAYGANYLLQEGKDYIFHTDPQVNAGSYPVTVEFIGNFSGSQNTTWSIDPANISEANVRLKGPYLWSGSPVCPEAVVTFNGIELSEGKDYTVSYTNNNQPGLGHAEFTGLGNFDYTKLVLFRIEEDPDAVISLDTADILLVFDEYETAYTGQPIHPSVTVYCSGKMLEENTDYTLEFSDCINAGTASVTVTGIGRYTGTRQKNYTIDPAPLTEQTLKIAYDATQYYRGQPVDPDPVVTWKNTRLIRNIDYTVSCKNNDRPGQASFTVQGIGNFTGSLSRNFQIVSDPACSLQQARIDGIAASYTYTGQAIRPEPAVTLNGVRLVKDRDYSCTYTGNVNTGTAKLTITGLSPYTGKIDRTFEIVPADLSSDEFGFSCDPSFAWTGSPVYPAVTSHNPSLTEGRDYRISYPESPVNPGIYSLIIQGTGNYTGMKVLNYTIVKVSVQPVYRLYNPNSGEHHYTLTEREKDYLSTVGWKYEGIAWQAPEHSITPVYRVYNPNGGDHHYTSQLKEKDFLVKAGWKYEGIAWYSDDSQGAPLYRLYNPNAKTGSHHYTTSAQERDALQNFGWKYEGIGWYGVH